MKPKLVTHSFPELLNKKILVPTHNLRKFPEEKRTSYALPWNKEGQFHKKDV